MGVKAGSVRTKNCLSMRIGFSGGWYNQEVPDKV